MRLRHIILVLLSAAIVSGCSIDPEKVYQLRYEASASEIDAVKEWTVDKARFSYDKFSVQGRRAINEDFGDELSAEYVDLRSLTGFVVEFKGWYWITGTSEYIQNRCNANPDRTDYDCKSYLKEEFHRCEYGLEYSGQGESLFARAVLHKLIVGDVEVPKIMWPSTARFCLQ